MRDFEKLLTTMTTKDAQYWIGKLNLEPHPEGGFYRQTYRAELQIPQGCLPRGFGGVRAASTAIYFLLEGENFSAFHRLRSDEMWHFYAGSGLVVHVIAENGMYSQSFLGADCEAGEEFQAVVKAGSWFASEIAQNPHFSHKPREMGHPHSKLWALVGCTVAPGFDFADFEMAKREELAQEFPQHRRLIERLTRE